MNRRIAQTAEQPSVVFGRLAARAPSVARDQRPWGFVAGLGGIAVLGLVVFLSLSGSRSATAQTTGSMVPPAATASTPPPSTSIYSGPPPRPLQGLPPGFGPGASDASASQWGSPAMVVDLSDPASDAAPAASGGSGAAHGGHPDPGPAANQHPQEGAGFADDQFAAHVSGTQPDAAYASQLHDTALIVPQGTVIPAILETAINSDLPGFVRAVVSRDVRGFDGSTVLIPRGSKLVGQYRNAVAIGASRAFIVWSRLLTPDGVSVDIGSPAADPLGRGGLAGETNTHFFQRFGAAVLLTVLTAGTEALANANTGGNTAIIIGSPQQATNVAAIALQKYIDIPPTITVSQGAPMRVFVARDLDFSGVVQRRP